MGSLYMQLAEIFWDLVLTKKLLPMVALNHKIALKQAHNCTIPAKIVIFGS
jgi:hypothetical protein